MHGIDEGELEIEPFRLLRQFSTLLKFCSEKYPESSSRFSPVREPFLLIFP